MRAKRTKPLSRIGRIFADGQRIDEALRCAVRDMIREHAADDAPVVIWRDGRVAWVPARELIPKTPAKTSRRRTRVAGR
jgi:hypothetical protein